MKRLTFSLFILIITANLFSQQIYPVRTITTVSPPYPTSLEQYANIDGGQISLTLIPNDAALQNYPIKLRLVIDGGYYKIYTNPSFIHKNITLNNGENLTFTGPELAEWFNPDNLIFEGYTKNQYQKTGRLPEGMYQIWFEAYDFYRNINISGPLKEIKATVWTFENDPPYLNFPLHEKELLPTDPQNIVFNWTQRQSPFSAAGAANQYKFELWEITPDDMNVDEAVQTTRPLFSGDVQTTTFNYTADQPILFTGKKYAWRVQVYDPAGKNRYKNNGYSEVRWFRFGKDCTAPAPTLDKAYFTAVGLKWDNDIRFNKYEIRYKNKDIANSNWYTKDATGQAATIDKLEQNTSYYVQMRGFCGAQEGEFSPSITVHTKQDVSFACGGAPGAIDSANNIPLAALKKGEVFHAWDFDVEVFSTTGSNGNFSGKGFALVPLLNSIKFQVEFNGITINDKRRMTQGEVKFVYDAKNGLVVNVNQLIDAITGNGPHSETDPYQNIANENIQVNSPVTDIEVNASGDVTVSTEDGNKQVVRASAATGDMVYVGDSDEGAEQAVVDTKGKTVYTGAPEKTASGAIVQPASKNEPLKYAVNFVPHVLTTWGGMDMPGSNSPAGNYNTVTIGGTQTLIPWKSVETNSIERLVAVVDGAADSIHFITKSDNMVMSAPGDKSNVSAKSSDVQMLKDAGILEHLNTGTFKQLLVTGVTDNDELKAWYPEYSKKDKDTVATQDRVLAGQVNVVAYDKINLDVCIVEVNGAAVPDALPIEEELNKIYASALVQWKVTQIKDFKATVTHLVNGKFDSDHPGSMKYNDCENEVIDAFKNRDDYNSHTLYLFFIGGQTTNTGTKGYMQFDRNFGFIFRDNQDINELIRTMAHELGHGAFRLKHTFSDECPYPQTQGNTYNLMDYVGKDKATTAIQFYKYQWDQIRKWSLGLNWFEGGSEGESFSSDYYFLDPTGFPFKINEKTDGPSDAIIINTKGLEAQPLLYPNGSLWGFRINNAEYEADISNGEFKGYKSADGNYYPRTYDNNKNIKQIKIVHYFGNCVGTTKVITLNNPRENVQSKQSTKVVSSLTYSINNNETGVELEDCKNDHKRGNIPFNAKNPNNANTTIVDYSGIDGNSLLPDGENSFQQTAKTLGEKFGIDSKIYVINKQRSDYEQLLASANSDPSPNKYIFIIDDSGTAQVVDFQHKFSPPQWFLDLFPNMNNNPCVTQYINDALIPLHKSDDYIHSDLLSQIKSEYLLAIYRGFFGMWYCATSENAVANDGTAKQFFTGFTHELISTLDIAQLITGIFQLVKTSATVQMDGYFSYLNDLKSVMSKVKDGTPLSYEDIAKLIIPPSLRSMQEGITMAVDIVKNVVNSFINCNNVCAYRYGQLTFQVLPIIFTGGEYLLTKVGALKTLAGEIAITEERAAEVFDLLKKAKSEGKTIESQTNKIIIKKDGEVVTTIEKEGNELKVLAEGADELADAFINGWTKDKVIDEVTKLKAQGKTLNPSTYLDSKYITNHLEKFKGKASYLLTGSDYRNFVEGKATAGRVDGLYISTSAEIDAVLAKANGDVAIIEKELGIHPGDWQGKSGIYRIDIDNPENFNLRMPNGSETGANSLWQPGGYTSGGKIEAVTDPIPNTNINANKVIN